MDREVLLLPLRAHASLPSGQNIQLYKEEAVEAWPIVSDERSLEKLSSS